MGNKEASRKNSEAAIARDIKTYTLAAVTGILCGFAGAAFHYVLDRANDARGYLRDTLASVPIAGWVILAAVGVVMVTLSLWLVRRFAPETSGSGVQEVEGILQGLRKLRWQRVLPVKFIAGSLAIGAGLVLGREGPTIHIGSALGKMVSDWGRLNQRHTRALIAAGAGAGLAAAFNAPLAGIIFVTEEMREEFEYTFVSLQSVILACCMCVVINDWWLGQGPFLPVQKFPPPALTEVPLFAVMGVLIGAFGVLFNRLLLGSLAFFSKIKRRHTNLVAGSVGLVVGVLVCFFPDSVGGGESLVQQILSVHWTFNFLFTLFAVRTFTSVGSYGSGVPGGIFAPMLALGTLAGIAFTHFLPQVFMAGEIEIGAFAVAGMGALFAATVRAPLTGIALVVELTGAYNSILVIILTCLSATFTAQLLGGRPIYHLLLDRTLREAGKPEMPEEIG